MAENIDKGEGDAVDNRSNEDVVGELADDYAEYLKVDYSKEKHQLEDSVEDLLTRLDEYGGLVDLVRSDTSLCLNRTLAEIHKKGEELNHIFDRIDKLEAYVAMVKQNVTHMEELVNKAESEMGSFSSIKKVFDSFSMPSFLSKKTAAPKEVTPKAPLKYTAPVIFNTKDYLDLDPASNSPASHNDVVPEDVTDSNMDSENRSVEDPVEQPVLSEPEASSVDDLDKHPTDESVENMQCSAEQTVTT